MQIYAESGAFSYIQRPLANGSRLSIATVKKYTPSGPIKIWKRERGLLWKCRKGAWRCQNRSCQAETLVVYPSEVPDAEPQVLHAARSWRKPYVRRNLPRPINPEIEQRLQLPASPPLEILRGRRAHHNNVTHLPRGDFDMHVFRGFCDPSNCHLDLTGNVHPLRLHRAEEAASPDNIIEGAGWQSDGLH